MKKAHLTVNYKAKIQVLEGANADELLANPVVNSYDPEVHVTEYEVEDGTTEVVESDLLMEPDMFNIDVRMKVVVEYSDGDIEDIVDTLEFDMDGLFVVWDWEVYGWGVETLK